MNKTEYYRQRRIFRAAISSINRLHLSHMSKDEKDAVWNLFWAGIYMKMPLVIYNSLVNISPGNSSWPLTSRSAIRCNYINLPNSYPHKTRNP